MNPQSVILVTGSSRGLGRGIAESLAKAGVEFINIREDKHQKKQHRTDFISLEVEITLSAVLLRNVRHIYSQPLDIRVGDLRVRQFSLNRHLLEQDWVARHTHPHAQFLLYLTGNGTQKIDLQAHPVHPGSLFFLPTRCEHSYAEGNGRRPLCLSINLDLPEAVKPAQASLTQVDLQVIRQALPALHHWHPGNEAVEPVEAAAVLRIVQVFLRATRLLQTRSAPNTLPVVRRVREVFRENISQLSPLAPIMQAAEMVGYHPDHLTRILRRETGMSASQLRAVETLKKAQSLLASPASIADVAEKSGFADPNYFARWFRKQTGQTPRQWRGQR